MALIKKKAHKGFEGEYWRIIQINCNADRNDAVATFALYKDEATRLADATAVLDSFQVDLGEDFNDSVINDDTKAKDKVKKSAYEALKTKALIESEKTDDAEETKDESLAFFSDAIDNI